MTTRFAGQCARARLLRSLQRAASLAGYTTFKDVADRAVPVQVITRK